MLFTDSEIKELVFAVGEVRRILREQAQSGCLYTKNRLEVVEEIMKKLEVK